MFGIPSTSPLVLDVIIVPCKWSSILAEFNISHNYSLFLFLPLIEDELHSNESHGDCGQCPDDQNGRIISCC